MTILTQPSMTTPPAVMPTTAPTENPDDADEGNAGGGGIGEGLGAVGGGGNGASMMGTDSTVMPNKIDAAAAVAKLEESEEAMALIVLVSGTNTVTVNTTDPAAIVTVTFAVSTPAAMATADTTEVSILASKLERSPEAVIVTETDGGDDGGGAIGLVDMPVPVVVVGLQCAA